MKLLLSLAAMTYPISFAGEPQDKLVGFVYVGPTGDSPVGLTDTTSVVK